jgi:hypothetical protein
MVHVDFQLMLQKGQSIGSWHNWMDIWLGACLYYILQYLNIFPIFLVENSLKDFVLLNI